MLGELTREFIPALWRKRKREKNILDFTDMEHFALEILMNRECEDNREDGRQDGMLEISEVGYVCGKDKKEGAQKYVYHMSAAARELSLKDHEVMVDEYQDSNLVQEMIIYPRVRLGHRNGKMFLW